jgi:GT2 family glycosyltransferase
LDNKGISVVIPNFNGRELLPEILPPLFIALKATNLSYEVIVCDDCSKDDSINYILSNFPEIHLLKQETNKGFSPTVNKGIFAARYDYVFIMNNDLKVTEHYFNPLFKYFEDEKTFGVMGRINEWDTDTIQDAAKYPYFQGAKIKTNKNYYAENSQPNDRLYSIYLSGANAFVDRKKIIELKGFNELFAPFYVEDFELSLRAWRMGWKCYYEHHAVCYHKTSVTIKKKKSKNYIRQIYNRNKFFLHAIHLNSFQLAQWFIQLFFEMLFNILKLNIGFLKSFYLFARDIKKVSKSRKELAMLAIKNKVELLDTKLVVQTLKNKIDRFKTIKFTA